MSTHGPSIRYWVSLDGAGNVETLGRTVHTEAGLHGELLTPRGWVERHTIVESLFGHGDREEISRQDAARIADDWGQTLE